MGSTFGRPLRAIPALGGGADARGATSANDTAIDHETPRTDHDARDQTNASDATTASDAASVTATTTATEATTPSEGTTERGGRGGATDDRRLDRPTSPRRDDRGPG